MSVSQDTDAVIEAIESGMDPNLIDDVGQTLLNWAAAFGTNDMVQVRPFFLFLKDGQVVACLTRASL